MAGPDINSFKYGYDRDGVNKYLDAIKSKALKDAAEAVKKIQGIEDVCNTNWKGKSKDNFLSNLEHDSDYVASQFYKLYDNLCNEITSVNAAMANKDEELIKKDSLFETAVRGW